MIDFLGIFWSTKRTLEVRRGNDMYISESKKKVYNRNSRIETLQREKNATKGIQLYTAKKKHDNSNKYEYGSKWVNVCNCLVSFKGDHNKHQVWYARLHSLKQVVKFDQVEQGQLHLTIRRR